MRGDKAVTVRLDRDELAALRQVPGDSDAARLRTLLHARDGTDSLASSIAATVAGALDEKLRAIAMEIKRDNREALKVLAQQLNAVFQTLRSQS